MAKPKPTWADYYAAVGNQARANALARGGGSGPTPNTISGPGTTSNLLKGITGGSTGGGGSRATGPKLYQQPLDWSEPTNLIAHGISNIPFIGDNIMSQLEDPSSMGSGIIDAMSRGLFTTQSALTELSNQVGKPGEKKGTPGLHNITDIDWGKVLGAGGQGALGQQKKTALDYSESQGLNNKGWGAFLRNTTQDIAMDPLSYVGIGLLGKAGRILKEAGASSQTLLKGTTEAAKTAEEVADPLRAGAKAVPQDLGNTVQDTLPGLDPNVQNPMAFLESLNAEATGAKAAPTPTVVAPEVAAGPDFAGLMEQLGIKAGDDFAVPPVPEQAVGPQPSAALIARQAKMSQADEVAQGIQQRVYSPETAAALPEKGFWDEVTTKIPEETPEAPPVKIPENLVEDLTPAIGEDAARTVAAASRKSPLPTFAYERTKTVQAQHAKVEALNGEDLEGITDPVERAVLEDLNAKVPAKYVENPKFEGATSWEPQWIPDPKNPKFRTVGELRYIETHAHEFPDSVVKRADFELKEYQGAHLADAEIHDAVFKTGPEGYLDEIYGTKHTPAPAAKPKPKRTTALPAGPLKPVPKYKEIQEFKELDAAEKQAVLTRLDEELGIQPEHVEFLSQAANPKEYAKRLEIVKDAMRTSKDIQDVSEGIKSGRITSVTDPGVPEAMELFGVKTLKGLSSRIDKAVKDLSDAEQKLVDKYFPVDKEGNPLPPKTEAYPSSKVPAVTPQGRKVEKMATEAAEKAKKPATEQVVENANKVDASDLLEASDDLDMAQHGMLARALNHSVNEGVLKGMKMPFRTKGGVATDVKGKGGNYIRLDSWNKNTAQNAFHSLIGDATKWFNAAKRGEKGSYRPAELRNRVMPVLKALDDNLRRQGVFPVAHMTSDSSAISMHDVLDSIDTKWVNKNIFTTQNRGKGVFESVIMPTQVMDAVEVGLAAMRKTGGELPEDMANLRKMMEEAATANKSTKNNRMPNHVLARNKTPEAMDEFMQPIVDALPDLYKRSEMNGRLAKEFHDSQVEAGTKTILEDIARRIENPSAGHRAMMNLGVHLDEQVIKPAVEAHNLSPEDAAAATANAAAAEQIPPAIRGAGKEAEENARASKAGKTKGDVHKQQAAEQDARKANPTGTDAEIKEDGVIAKMIQSIFPAYGNPEIHGMRSSRVTHDKNVHHLAVAQLTKANAHGKTLVTNAFDALKMGKTFSEAKDGAAVVQAQRDLNNAIEMIFAPNKGYSAFEANNLTALDINSHLSHFSVPERFHLDPRKPLHDQWKNFETDDIISLLDQYTQATIAATTKKHIGNSIMAEPQWASSTAKKGYHKFELPHDSELAKYIDTENMYYHEDIIKEMHIYDRFLKSTARWSSKNHTQTIKYYDEVFHAWKAGVTVYRPGHHVRNGIGDIWFNYMAGMTNPKWYAKAVELQKAMPAGAYDSYGAVGQLLRGETPELALQGRKASSSQPFMHTTIGGKKHGWTMQTLIQEAEKRGLLPDYRTGEDISGAPYKGSIREKLSNGPGINIRGKRSDFSQPAGGRIKKVVTKSSEAREHNVRLAQFMFELDKKSYGTVEEALDQAAARVRKWHPDGSDLTPIEQNLFRRTTGFYSWIRKAIPLVLEGMAVRPGRFMAYPKAMYNLAESRGIDLQSLSEPFPEDKRYPDWIRDGLQGPLFNLGDAEVGIAPGIPGMDVLGDYVNAPGATGLGSMAEILKVPFEIAQSGDAFAKDARTGIPTYDKSDYIDKQIPQASYFSGLTGRSLTQPWQAVGGNKNKPEDKDDAARTLFNWITGLSASQLDKPAYQKQAKREESSRKSEIKRRAKEG